MKSLTVLVVLVGLGLLLVAAGFGIGWSAGQMPETWAPAQGEYVDIQYVSGMSGRVHAPDGCLPLLQSQEWGPQIASCTPAR